MIDMMPAEAEVAEEAEAEEEVVEEAAVAEAEEEVKEVAEAEEAEEVKEDPMMTTSMTEREELKVTEAEEAEEETTRTDTLVVMPNTISTSRTPVDMLERRETEREVMERATGATLRRSRRTPNIRLPMKLLKRKSQLKRLITDSLKSPLRKMSTTLPMLTTLKRRERRTSRNKLELLETSRLMVTMKRALRRLMDSRPVTLI